MTWWHWLLVHLFQETGISNSASRAYNLWSGFAGEIRDLVELPLLALLFAWHHNCHSKGCWRIGRHPVDGTPFKVCRRCHPDQAPSRDDIHAAHTASQEAPMAAPIDLDLTLEELADELPGRVQLEVLKELRSIGAVVRKIASAVMPSEPSNAGVTVTLVPDVPTHKP